jgi:nitric oxide reductase NorD protein
MSFDEYLFGKAAGYLKKKKLAALDVENRTAKLELVRDKLTIISRALTGSPIEIFPAEREGGYKGNNFFLPISFSKFLTQQENISFYFFRTLYLAIQKKLSINWYESTEPTTETAQQKAVENSTIILAALFEEYPIAKGLFESIRQQITNQATVKEPADYSWLFGKLMKDNREESSKNKLKNFSDKIKKAAESTPITTLKAKAVEEVISIEVDKKQQEDYVLTHNFEKVETADEFNGVWRDFDGDDDLLKHQNALDELNMKFTVRVDDTAHSVYQSDFMENTSVSESDEADLLDKYISYDEWDYSKRAYKKDYCKLFSHHQQTTDADYYINTIAQNAGILTGLRKMLANVNNKLQQQRRQTQGAEFDIDSVTDLYADVHSGHTPSEKIYIANRKKEKDISILLLLDISLSSDSYAAGNRVIDVEKKVAILFGEILNEFNIDFSINCFFSKTRNYSTYLSLKGFDEDWNKSKYKIGAVEPGGYTRIGTALRHSGELLDKRHNKNKWVILISDGKPNDFDRYEGKYGINDVVQALRELNQKYINAYALAIEANAKYYLPQMFGQNHYQILSSPTELLTSLVRLYEKIRYQS